MRRAYISHTQRFLSLFLALVLVAVLSWPISVAAFQTYGGNTVTVSSDDTIEDDVYASGGTVNSSADINGDFSVAGGSLESSGKVSGDLQAAGGNITINGKVGDDVRMAGGDLTVNASVNDDVLSAGGNILVAKDVTVGGALRAFASRVQLNGTVNENAYISGDEFVLTGTVNGDLTFEGERITIAEDAKIKGDLSYSKTANADIAESSVAGNITKAETPAWKKRQNTEGINVTWTASKWLMSLVAALVIGYLFRNTVQRTIAEGFGERKWQNLGIGLLGLIVAPVVSGVLLITVIGIPLGILGVLTFITHVLVASIITPIALGSLIDRYIAARSEPRVNWLVILVGVIIMQILLLIPVVGGLIGLLLTLFVLGALWRMLGRTFFGKKQA